MLVFIDLFLRIFSSLPVLVITFPGDDFSRADGRASELRRVWAVREGHRPKNDENVGDLFF